MIIVTGASGQLGGAILERLLDRVAPDQVVAVARDPRRVTHLSDRGVQVRRGDFTVPETLPDAFAGASQVLIVSGPAEAEPHRAAIDAAVAAGAERIVYTSHQAANPDSTFLPGRTHAETERDLQDCGVPFTSLRDGFHATSSLFVLGRALETGELVTPVGGPISWTAQADLAAAAVVALTEPDRLPGITPPLTGPEALDHSQVAALAVEITGRPIRHVELPDDEFSRRMTAAGTPEVAVGMMLGMFQAARGGEFDVVDPTLEQLLGHRPTDLRHVLQQELGHR